MAKIHGPYPIEIEAEGKTYRATYTVEGKGATATVRLSSEFGSRSTQAGASGAELTAKRLLGELIAWSRMS